MILKINTEQFDCQTCRNFRLNKVAKVWNDIPRSVVTVINTKRFVNQLNNGKVSKIIDKYLKCL